MGGDSERGKKFIAQVDVETGSCLREQRLRRSRAYGFAGGDDASQK